jgi:hypothetical protein
MLARLLQLKITESPPDKNFHHANYYQSLDGY